MTARAAGVIGVALAASAAAARADDGPLAAPTLVPAQAVAVAAAIEGELDGDAADVAADVWYGVGTGLTLGLRHSQRGVDAIGAGRGLCLRGCRAGDDRYRGVALTARFPLAARLTAELATDVTAWSPAHAAVTVGAIADWRDGRRWARATARLGIGLLGRADGNRDRATVEATVGVPLAGRFGVEVGVGVAGPPSSDYFAEATAPAWAQLDWWAGRCWGLGLAIGTDDVTRGDRTGYGALTVAARLR
ncbi:MAG: hypothetical protein JNK64_34935 [Myxococcales bacterium]|nr:hypothetical protein [Myxococcales bacterium]